ncbi:nucleotide-diphospho-sugar transferase [Dentipellis sp. KUC8613]|nr:nucleotide-diphospho-sugar transferase [Dentipellis sp. KUC8613]
MSDTNTDAYLFTPTQDWFTFNIANWKTLFPRITSPAPRVLEIGSWEGRSAIFLLTELCNPHGSIVCIDHFDLFHTAAGRERHRKLTHNLSLTGKPHRILDHFSFPALMLLLEEEMSSTNPGFDWVYVDGSHEADDTFLDGELAWRLARKGAVFIFDDYKWSVECAGGAHHPQRGVDAFMALHAGEYERISGPEQYQMILQKTTEMRIGFLVKDKAGCDGRLANALGYGINVVYTVDSAYAMPAAVSIRSLLENTRSKVTVYVVDCGLAESDRTQIQDSIPHREDTSLIFLDVPAELASSATGGATWAKVHLSKILPVERVLYLDGDTLIRSDIKELWDTDLQGNALGAVVDVGYPTGHAGASETQYSAPYFNAGVMLMDLTQIRARQPTLEESAQKGLEMPYGDQDVLNAHFQGDWSVLPMKWNAQGLGTYANAPSAEGNALNIPEVFNNPSIVHFTGPVHPDMEAILNPYVQPCTAKPWGYLGAPGHPYAEAWWSVLERTSWKGYRDSDAFKVLCKEGSAEATRRAVAKFEERVRAGGAPK